MPTPLEFILEKVLPEVENAVLDSAKRQNRIYNILVSLKQGTDNAEIKVNMSRTLPLLNLLTGLDAESSRMYREETPQTAIEKAKLDLRKLLMLHSEDKGKSSLTMVIREGAYTSAEWDFVDYRYFKNPKYQNSRKRPTYEVK
jgi:hypothetical protein